MSTNLDTIRNEALKAFAGAETSKELEELRAKYLGKDSELSSVLRNIKDLSPEEKTTLGKQANTTREALTREVDKRLAALRKQALEAKMANEFLDVTLPGQESSAGNLHPITKERIRVQAILEKMGFQVWEPMLVDSDYNNFTALNIPEGHPARDMWDTLRLSDNLSLIVHTSSMQNRILSSKEPPIRAIVPGKTFRNEATDARHEHSFFQVEGVYVDRGIKLSDLLGTIQQFLSYYFEREMPIKVQPTFFPFVEPGLEIMMECPVCKGAKPTDCPGCSGSGWMEVIPCGMIHPFVLAEAGIDPNAFSGFAWGFGLDRLIMIKHQLDDVRHFHSARLDFINQF